MPRYLRRGVHERITATGEVLLPLDAEQARAQLAVLKKCNVEGVAICLINAYVNHAHEEKLRSLVREMLGPSPVLDLERGLTAREGVRPRVHHGDRRPDAAHLRRLYKAP